MTLNMSKTTAYRKRKELVENIASYNVKKHQNFSGKYCNHRTLDLVWQLFLNMIQVELNNSKVDIDMKKLVTYYGDVDLFGAVMVAQKNRCHLMSLTDYKASGLKVDEAMQIVLK